MADKPLANILRSEDFVIGVILLGAGYGLWHIFSQVRHGYVAVLVGVPLLLCGLLCCAAAFLTGRPSVRQPRFWLGMLFVSLIALPIGFVAWRIWH